MQEGGVRAVNRDGVGKLWQETIWRDDTWEDTGADYRCPLYTVKEYESWTTRKAEHQRIDAFELWCWKRLLRVPWSARRSNQSILKEISPEYSLEGLMLKLKLQYFGHLIQIKNWFIWKDPDAGKDWRLEEKGMTEDEMVGWHHWLNGHWAASRRWWRTGNPGVLQSMRSQSRTWLSDWTTSH